MFGRRKSETRALTRESSPSMFLPDAGGFPMRPRASLAIADVFACVRVLADTAASLPLLAYRRTGTDRVRAGGRVQALLDQPAPATTSAGFLGHLVASLNLWGNAYLGKYRDPDGRVAQLALIAPESVTVTIKRGAPRYTVLQPGGVVEVGPEDILHIRAPMSEDGILGLSPIRQGREILGLSQALTTHAVDTMRRGARLSGVLSLPADAPVDRDNLDAMREEISRSWTGAENSGAIALVTGGLTFSPLAMPLSDAQFIEQRQLSTAEICRLFRVPPWMVGAPSGDSMTYSNTEQQSLSFITYSLRPWLVAIEQALSSDRDLMPASTYVEFLLDALLRADSATRAQVYTAALNAETGWMSRDEVRRLENLPAEGSP